MIFGFVLKYLKYIIDAAIIIALLLLLAYWDPFGLFGTRVKTHNTANLVTNIREMGELITAEYYGEVVASWKEGKIEEFSEDTVSNLVLEQYKDLKYALWEVYKASKDFNRDNDLRVKRRRIADILLEVNPDFQKTMVYYDLLTYIAKTRYGTNEDEEFKLLWLLYNEVTETVKKQQNDFPKQIAYLNADDGLNAKDFYRNFKNEIAADLFDSRSTRRKNIVFIGRGWVKAGFDFGNLNEDNFFYDKDNATITFLGIEPRILNADINPWFIPENRIKGFELVDYDGKVNFQDAILVKKTCKQKLRDQALGAGILESADENGKIALASFFSLVLGTEIKNVSFFANRYDFLLMELTRDKLITLEEALVIEKVYGEEVAEIEKENIPQLKEKKLKNLTRFLWHLKDVDYLEPGKGYSFNYFSSLCSRIIGSSTGAVYLKKEEMDSLYDLRFALGALESLQLPEVIRKDSLWFGTKGATYMADFNDAIYLLSRKTDEYDTLITGDYTLKDLCFDCPDYPEIPIETLGSLCKPDTAVTHPDLLALRGNDCRLIIEKLEADQQQLMEEKEKMMGIPYKLSSLRERIKSHFNPE